MYTITQAAEYFGVARETIRKWVIEFTPYLNNAANVEAGRKRRLSHQDMQVLALVSNFKADGKLFADIHEALNKGQRGEVSETDKEIVSVANNQQVILMDLIESLKDTIATLNVNLEQSNQIRARAEGRENLLQDMLKEAYAEIARLNRLLGPEK